MPRVGTYRGVVCQRQTYRRNRLIFLPVGRYRQAKNSSSLRDSGKENFILRIGIFGSYARREMVGGIEKTLHTVGTLLKILMYPGLFLELLEVA